MTSNEHINDKHIGYDSTTDTYYVTYFGDDEVNGKMVHRKTGLTQLEARRTVTQVFIYSNTEILHPDH